MEFGHKYAYHVKILNSAKDSWWAILTETTGLPHHQVYLSV